jgi:predicted small metal-binding protein
MTKTFTCKELGGVCDAAFSGDSLMSIMQKAMPHMQSDEAHREHIAQLAETSGESQEQWFERMQTAFDGKPTD